MKFPRRLKIPKMKMPKMDKRKKRFLIVSLIALSFFIAGGIMFSPEGDRDIFQFGTPTYQTSTLGILAPLTADSTVNSVTSDLKISFTWGNDGTPPVANDFHVILRTSIFDNIEDVYSTKSGNTYTFNFGLLNCYAGTHTYYLTFYAIGGSFFYSGDSFRFEVYNLVEVVEPPTFIERPDDVGEAVVDYPYTLTWKFQYTEPCDITLEQDGVEIDTRTFSGLAFTQDYSYVFTPTTEGDWVFKFTLDPTTTAHLSLTDTVTFGAITMDEYTLQEGLPEGVECKVEVAGQVAFFNILPSKQVWNAEFAAPAMTPLDSKMTIVLHTFAFVSAEVRFFKDDVLTDTFSMKRAIGTWWVDIDLVTLADGEYRVEIIVDYLQTGWSYRITTFNIAVRVFPISWFVVNIGFLLLIGVLSVGTIIALRQFRGWWGFRGRYAV